MTKTGKELQELVRRIEAALGDDCEVKSPDWLEDRSTGTSREVDVSIRRNVGSQAILIIAECRDHNRKVGSPYVEQIIQKKADLRANKAVIVSTTGFTAPAQKKARLHGISLMTMNQAMEEDWCSWMACTTLDFYKRHSAVRHLRLIAHNSSQGPPAPDPPADDVSININTSRPLFLKSDGTEWGSVNALVNTAFSQNDTVYGDLIPGGERKRKIIPIQFSDDLYVDWQGEKVRITGVVIWAELWIEVEHIPFDRWEYRETSGEPLAEYAEARFDLPTGPSGEHLDGRFYLVRSAEGMHVRVETHKSDKA